MARVTFAPVIYSQYKRQDGTYSVKMRITHNRKSRYVTTSEVASPSQLTRSLAIKDTALLARLRDLENRMRAAVADIDMYALSKMDVDDVVRHIAKMAGGEFRLDFLAFWEEAVAGKAEGSRKNYLIALRNFKRFLGVETLDVSRYGKGARPHHVHGGCLTHLIRDISRIEGVLMR